MELAVLRLCSITTLVRRGTLQPSVEWNAKSLHYLMLVAVNNTTCQVIHMYSTVLA